MIEIDIEISVFWFRRDLCLNDNAGFYKALTSGYKVLPIFIFDKDILGKVKSKGNAQVVFIHRQVSLLKAELEKYGSSLKIAHGVPLQIFEELMSHYRVKAVYTNEDYELQAHLRDTAVKNMLHDKGIGLHTYKNQTVFSKNDVLKDDGKPYTVFTPYSRKWRSRLEPPHLSPYPSEDNLGNLLKFTDNYLPSLADLGFTPSNINFPSSYIDNDLISRYHLDRDYPALKGTSHLGIHLRFGTISIRELIKRALELNDTFLNELIWREFYFAITWHFPHVSNGSSFKKEYDNIEWRNNTNEFEAWCMGQTGYPFVDAGMRELNATGFMHNRARMIAASFLAKHLLIDWRWGEAYFANKLLDFDFSANNGGWQWAASCGCDATHYFRIFNPYLQAKKFDKDQLYIKQWVSELNTANYPEPIVNHEIARQRALKIYSKVNALRIPTK